MVKAFAIDGCVPELLTDAGGKIDEGAGKQCIAGAVSGEDETDGFKGFADDKRDAVLGGLEKKIAVDGGRKTGDDNSRHILQRQASFTFLGFTGQLAVAAGQLTLRPINVDDVIRQKARRLSVEQAQTNPGLSQGKSLPPCVSSAGFAGF